jgi:hypothetical protein
MDGMKLKIITVATTESPWLAALRKSMDRLGLDYEVLGLGQPWRGFGMKVILTREYLRTLEGYTHFVFVDAYDVIFLKPLPEVPDIILFNAEKHCWPNPELAGSYPIITSPWRFLNSGVYSGPIWEYLDLVDKYPIEYADDDQAYFTNIFLKEPNVWINDNCTLFQSYAFETPGDFTLKTDKLINNITGSEPAVIHFNGKCHDSKIYNMIKYATLAEVQQAWIDRPEVHKEIHETFIERVNEQPELNAHRTFVENHVFGFGERSFHWLWHLVIKEMPEKFTFLEIGVLKGQTLSLCEMLAQQQGKKAKRYGVTPLSTEGGVWESDYAKDIELIHDTFNLAKNYTILNGLSEDPEIIKKASKLKLDVLYVDGGHDIRHITNDIEHYAPLVKVGGYMVIDDCCNRFHMPFGFFQGIESVSRVVDSMLPPFTQNDDWQFIASVVHNRVYKKVK